MVSTTYITWIAGYGFSVLNKRFKVKVFLLCHGGYTGEMEDKGIPIMPWRYPGEVALVFMFSITCRHTRGSRGPRLSFLTSRRIRHPFLHLGGRGMAQVPQAGSEEGDAGVTPLV